MKAEEILQKVRWDFPESGKIVVGLSGGADSVLLTDLLFEHFGASRLCCAHVHHGLRGAEADEDARFCKTFCAARGIPFVRFHRDVARIAAERGEGIEAAGRRERYACFFSLLDGPNDTVATAHNADDNAETLLLHLVRGMGPQGAAGIPARRDRIRRPLLAVSRAEVEFLCAARGLSYQTDSTNASRVFARNRIRQDVVPVLRELNPRFTEAVSRFTESMATERSYIESQAAALLHEAQTLYGLSVPVLRGAHSAVLRAALSKFLSPSGETDAAHLALAERCVREGGSVSLPRGGVFSVRQDSATLSFGPAAPFSVPVTGPAVSLPDGRTVRFEEKIAENEEKNQNVHSLFFNNALDCAKITGVPVLRTRKGGERFAPIGRGLHKPLKKLFNELRIPAAARDSLLLLEVGGEIAWVENVGPAEGFGVTNTTERMLCIRVDKSKA